MHFRVLIFYFFNVGAHDMRPSPTIACYRLSLL